MYQHINKCMPKDDEILKASVDVFAQLPGSRNAFQEYFGGIRGRVEILRSNPRELSNPPGIVYTFPGLKSEHKTGGYPAIPTTFDNWSIDHYQRLHETFKLPARCCESDMQRLQSLIVYEIQYLRGCDLQWVPQPAGKFSSLAMLQGKALTARVRAGAGGPEKDAVGRSGFNPAGKFSSLAMLQDKALTVHVRADSGDESSSSVEFLGLEEAPPPPPHVPSFAQPPLGGMVPPAGEDSDSDDTLLTILDPPAAVATEGDDWRARMASKPKPADYSSEDSLENEQPPKRQKKVLATMEVRFKGRVTRVRKGS